MNTKNPLITLLVLFYLITFSKTILLYYTQIYFPDLDYMVSLITISQEFAPYAQIIKIIMIFIVFSMIPCLFLIKKNIQENYSHKNIPLAFIAMFALAPPLLVLINNFMAADFLFSIALLIYGVIFTILAFKYR